MIAWYSTFLPKWHFASVVVVIVVVVVVVVVGVGRQCVPGGARLPGNRSLPVVKWRPGSRC